MSVAVNKSLHRDAMAFCDSSQFLHQLLPVYYSMPLPPLPIAFQFLLMALVGVAAGQLLGSLTSDSRCGIRLFIGRALSV